MMAEAGETGPLLENGTGELLGCQLESVAHLLVREAAW